MLEIGSLVDGKYKILAEIGRGGMSVVWLAINERLNLILKQIDEKLSQGEKEIFRRGRNAQNHHIPKNATLDDYSHATAYEALIGYLYLTKQDERLKEILEMCKF